MSPEQGGHTRHDVFVEHFGGLDFELQTIFAMVPMVGLQGWSTL
jgi:hypothetical protein